MDNCAWIKYWRIATSLGGLATGFFIGLGLPPPSLPDFKPYTQLMPQSQGGLSEQGYQNVTILWDFMTYRQVTTLTGIIDTATNSTLWATIDRAHGSGVNDFIEVSGIVRPLLFDPINNGRGVVFSNVQLTLTNLTIVNDPSSLL